MENRWSHIVLSDFFDSQLNNRASVALLFERVKKSKAVAIDFSGIDFISRSAAHEILTFIDEVQKKGIDFTFTNMAPNIDETLQKVSASRKQNFKRATFVKRLSFGSEKDLEDFLLAI
ncbi:MAG: STAS domain-containing protein [Cyclobacteriaceae bacterium]|nr:STAS domain-containing protein [Cyclobacteriaceae bacterium]